MMVLGTVVYSLRRSVGLAGPMGEHSTVRDPAKRRRVHTGMQTLIYVAGRLYQRGRRLWLRLSQRRGQRT